MDYCSTGYDGVYYIKDVNAYIAIDEAGKKGKKYIGIYPSVHKAHLAVLDRVRKNYVKSIRNVKYRRSMAQYLQEEVYISLI